MYKLIVLFEAVLHLRGALPLLHLNLAVYRITYYELKAKSRPSRTAFAGTPCRNRTYNCPLGGGCYIHLTKEAYHKEYYSIFRAGFQVPAKHFVCFSQKLCGNFVARKLPAVRSHYFLAFPKVFLRTFCGNNNCELICLKALNVHENWLREGKKWRVRRRCLI